MLKIDNLHAEIDGKTILNGLTLEIPAGEVHAIMGPNGAGKSTLAYVLGGRPGYEVTQGSVSFNGVDLLDLEPSEYGLLKMRPLEAKRFEQAMICLEEEFQAWGGGH